MSLPGLGLTEPEEVTEVETAQHDLAKESEWRFEVAVDKYIQVKVSQLPSASRSLLTVLGPDRIC